MNWVLKVSLFAGCMMSACLIVAADVEKDVPWRAQAEIARRGAMVERID
jgi:hypothetical protein